MRRIRMVAASLAVTAALLVGTTAHGRGVRRRCRPRHVAGRPVVQLQQPVDFCADMGARWVLGLGRVRPLRGRHADVG